MAYQFKAFDKVLYRDKDSHTWRPGFYGYQVYTNGGMHKIIGEGITYECVPYEGNERLSGTNDIIKSDCPFNYGDHIEWFGGSGRWWQPGLFIKVSDKKGAHDCTLYIIVDDYGRKEEIRHDFVRAKNEVKEPSAPKKFRKRDVVEIMHADDFLGYAKSWKKAYYEGMDANGYHSVKFKDGGMCHHIEDAQIRPDSGDQNVPFA